MRSSSAFVFELMFGKIHGPPTGRGRYPTRAHSPLIAGSRVTIMSTPVLALVANAGDGTVSTFRIADGRLERLAVSTVGAGCSTLAIDPERHLVYVGAKP